MRVYFQLSMDSDKNKVHGDKEMADLLNKYFASVFTPPCQQAPPHVAQPSDTSASDLTVSASMVKKKIMKLRPASVTGPDRIGPQVLQELVDKVSPALAAIFNSFLQEGLVTADWQQANVTPIYKKGSKADLGNYRPVSLT